MRKGKIRISQESTSAPKLVPVVSAVISTPSFCSWSRNDCPAWGGMAVV